MSRILIVTQYTQLPGEDGNNRGRFKYIAELLVEKGHQVTVLTSDFRELDRKFRINNKAYQEAPYEIVLLKTQGYKNSISFNRLKSMTTYADNLKKYLDTQQNKFDLVYSCVPGLKSSLNAGRFAKAENIPFIIDVQDVWPEAMYRLLDNNKMNKIIFSPIRLLANEVYKMADGIMAVSKTYMNIATDRNSISRKNDYVFIGSFMDTSNLIDINNIKKKENEYWISYIGSISHSYDLKTFLEGVEQAKSLGVNVRAIVMGTGPLEEKLKKFAGHIESNALFTGWLSKDKMYHYLNNSDAVINAIKLNSPASITNKVGDYLMSGKPMLNGSENQEMVDLLSENLFGINYEAENSESLAKAIYKLFSLPQEDREEMGANAKTVAENKFNRLTTYKKIIDMIESFL